MTRSLGFLFVGMFLVVAVLPASDSAGDTTVILVRHAEKELTGGDVPLRDPDGTQRARDLIAVVQSAGVDLAISSKYRRTRETIAPSVEALGLTAAQVLEITEPAEIAKEILERRRGHTILIAGHSNTVPQIVEALGAPSPCPPFEIDEKHGCMIPDPEYDHLFVVTIPTEGASSVVRALYGAASP